MTVIIGVDPHKATHTAVAISSGEEELDRKKVRSGGTQIDQLMLWAEPFGTRTWAIESAGGLGYLLAQQLVAAGESVVDVPATLASRARLLATGRSNKNDPNDAHSVAVAALRFRGLRRVEAVGHSEVLRLLAKRNTDIGNHRTRLVCRLHALLAELAPGGIAKEINASDVDRFLEAVTPATPVEQVRYDLAVELLDDIRRLDGQLKASHKRIRAAVEASGTSLTDLFGVGPIIAGMLIGYTGDVTRFQNRDQFAAYNGTAPVEFSSGGRVTHRLSERGNRKLNHAIHMAAICQLRQPHCDGRAYFERKVAQGKTNKEAIRALKRHISNAVYRHLVADARRSTLCKIGRDPGGQAGTTRSQRDRLYIPDGRLLGEVTPGPDTTLRQPTTSAPPNAPANIYNTPLTQRGFVPRSGTQKHPIVRDALSMAAMFWVHVVVGGQGE